MIINFQTNKSIPFLKSSYLYITLQLIQINSWVYNNLSLNLIVPILPLLVQITMVVHWCTIRKQIPLINSSLSNKNIMINFSFLFEPDKNFNTKILLLSKIIGKNPLIRTNFHVLTIKEFKYSSNISLCHKISPKNSINFHKNHLQFLKVNW